MLLSTLSICSCGSSNPILDSMVGGMSVARVESYFNLDAEQEKAFEKSLEKDLKTVKEKQFNEFALSIQTIDKRIPQEKNDSQILSEAFDLLEGEYNKASGHFKNSAVVLIQSLQPEQFGYFEQKVRKEIALERAESLDIKNAQLEERYRKQILYWVGKMNVHQENALSQFIMRHPFPWKERANNREAILNSFVEKKTDSKKIKAMTEQFMQNYDGLRTSEYALAIEKYENQFKDFLNKFWTSLSSEQKQQMQISLNKQAQELSRMAITSSSIK